MSSGGADVTAVLPLAELVRSLDPAPANAEYLAPGMRADLQALYTQDAATLRSLGFAITAVDELSPDRPFLPSFDEIAPRLLDLFFSAAASPAFVETHPVAASAASRLAASRPQA
jgi:hypothetical protein